MDRIAITGATGFIGSALVKKLSKDGLNVYKISRLRSKDPYCIYCDLSIGRIPTNIFNNIDTVIHLAGFAHDTNFNKSEDLYHAINTDATISLAKIAVKNNVKRFVFISSVKAGGVSKNDTCMDENNQTKPDGIYGKTKRKAEIKLLEMGCQSGMSVTIVRPSLVYGPNVKGNLQLMLLGINKGWFPPLPETGNKRSMIHVDDLVRAILLVADDDRANGEIFIATDSIPHSSREIYNAMCSVLDKSILKWSVPKFLFDAVSLINPRIKYKLNKLLGDECYSSAKLEALGFKAQKTLKDMNETDF